jgi:hypothetical protein
MAHTCRYYVNRSLSNFVKDKTDLTFQKAE